MMIDNKPLTTIEKEDLELEITKSEAIPAITA